MPKLRRGWLARLGRSYSQWRWHKLISASIALLLISAISLITYSRIFAVTSTAVMIPNGDVTTAYTPWLTSNGGTSHYSLVDDGTIADTSDYVHSSGGNYTDEYSFTSPSSILSASQLVLHVDCNSFTNANGGTMDTINIDLLINGTVQPGGIQYQPVYNSWGDCSVTFTGNWTQADVDNMDVQIYSTAQGSGSPSSRGDDVAVANIYGVLTYVPNLQLDQSAYRWFSNQDAPTGQSTFARTWGGTADECAYKCAIAPTSDGGFVTTGETNSYGVGGIDYFIAKYDSAGGLEWNKVVGGSTSDYSQYVIQTSDGGYAVTGLSDSYPAGGGYDIFLSKFDSSGNLSWSKTWGGSADDYGQSLIQTSDGSYVVASITSSYGAGGWDMLLTKLDSSGNMIWNKTWGGPGTDESMEINKDASGNYIVAGWTDGYGAGLYDAVLLKYDPNGNLIWQRTWGGSSYDVGESVVATADGGYAMTGYTSLGAGGYDLFLAKYDSAGTLMWNRTLGAAGTDDGRQVVQAADGSYIITGYTSSYGAGGNDLLLAKYDSSGNFVWARTMGGSSDEDSRGLAMTTDGGYVAAAYTKSFGAGGNDILIAKFDSAGSIVGCSSPLCQSVSPTSGSPSSTSATVSGTTGAVSPVASSTTFSKSSPSVPVSVVVPNSPPIDVGSPLAAQDTAATAPAEGTIFRLRMDIHASGGEASAGGTSLKLQYADKGAAVSCSGVSSSSYQDVSDNSSGIRWADNPRAGSSQGIVANAADPQHGSDPNVDQSYQEKGTTTFTNTSAILSGQDGMWDFALTTYRAYANHHYCLRVVNSSGNVIDSYSQYPELSIPPANVSQVGYRLFKNQDSSSSLASASWTEATAAAQWQGRYGYVSAAYNNKMWVMGGYNGSSFLSDVWSSSDGTNWTQVTASAPWGGNVDASLLVFNNKMWFMGGYTPAASGDTSDIWSSTDGVNWTKATTAPWSKRERFASFVFNNKMWVVGGSSNGAYLNDVWSSADGINWTQVNAAAPWSIRYRLSGVAYNGKMYIMGGTTNNSTNFLNDVWSSTDGINWTEETAAAPWPGRAYFTSVVYAGKIWVTGGYDATLNYNDWWYSSDGVNWTKQTAAAPWIARQGITGVVFNKKVWILGGYSPTSGNLNDAWSFYAPTTIDVGAPLAASGRMAELTSADSSQPFRLRLLLASDGGNIAPSDLSLKLQFARRQGGSCSLTPTANFQDVTVTSAIHFYDNPNADSPIQLVVNSNDPTDGNRDISYQTYSEANPFTNSESAIWAGSDGLWDFPLAISSGTGHSAYCFRVVNDDASSLSSYVAFPQISIAPQMQQLMRGGEWFSQSDYGNNISL